MSGLLKLATIMFLVVNVVSCTTPSTSWMGTQEKVLVFSKTTGFRHGSIEAGQQALEQLGREKGFQVELTEDSAYFTETVLQRYSAVVFLNTTGDVLNDKQQAAFERYIQAGGGFVGIHAAADTEYEWPWYGLLVGAYFDGHPPVQTATLSILDKSHPSTAFMMDSWKKKDEWYNFKSINPHVNVLVQIDESSYEGGTNGAFHPISWYHNYDGGRAFYTAMGHNDKSYSNPVFLQHLLGGVAYAMGDNSLVGKMPNESRFVRSVLDSNLNEPMELDELPGRGIIFVERRGAVKLYDFEREETRLVGQLDLFYGNEDGLLGVAVDPNYTENDWIYLFYSAPGDDSRQHISRFNLRGDTLDLDSEKVLLVIPTERNCCHSGGALEFGPQGNLFIAVGDNTDPFESDGYAPTDEREGRVIWDAQRSAANSNDLRGKILRIKPEDDGSYSIPQGNLYPEGTENARPEIYVMGCRNPFRPSIDSETGYLYWGDVGPDAGGDNPDRGPMGMGEFNQARESGFWGWPYTRGNNLTYNDYDFSTEKSGPKFDPANLQNNSPNNTGLVQLPPAQKSLVWYSYGKSAEFPWVGTGGVNPMAGPVFHASAFSQGTDTFPNYFENTIFLYEWMRDWVLVVKLDRSGKSVRRAESFMPTEKFSHPMDMIFGSDGSLYMLEYGQGWNTQNLDARLNRIRYASGNTKDNVSIAQVGVPAVSVPTDSADVPRGKKLINESDCNACHGVEALVNGPSYTQIAARYNNSDMDYLVNKVISGGGGVWGERHMSPHPQLSVSTVKEMVNYILLLNQNNVPEASAERVKHVER